MARKKQGKLKSNLNCTSCFVNSRCESVDKNTDSCPLLADRENVFDVLTKNPTMDQKQEAMNNALTEILSIQFDRISRFAIFEEVEGGARSPELHKEIEVFLELSRSSMRKNVTGDDTGAGGKERENPLAEAFSKARKKVDG